MKCRVTYHSREAGAMEIEVDSPADARRYMQQYFPEFIVDEVSSDERMEFTVTVDFAVSVDGPDTPEVRQQVADYLVDFLQQAREERYEDVDLPTFYVTSVEKKEEHTS